MKAADFEVGDVITNGDDVGKIYASLSDRLQKKRVCYTDGSAWWVDDVLGDGWVRLIPEPQLGPAIPLDKLEPSTNYWVLLDDGRCVVGHTTKSKILVWPDETLFCGYGRSTAEVDKKHIASIHAFDVQPAKPPQPSIDDRLRAILLDVYDGLHKDKAIADIKALFEEQK